MDRRPIRIAESRPQTGEIHLLRLYSIENRDAAAAFKDYAVFIRRDNRPALKDDEYLIRDLVGLRVAVGDSIVGEVVGVVLPSDLCDTASVASKMHSLLEIKLHSQKRLSLVPFVPAVVTKVDMVAGTVVVDPPPGLLDLTYEETKRIVIRGFLPEVATIDPQVRKWLETVYPFADVNTAASPRRISGITTKANQRRLLFSRTARRR